MHWSLHKITLDYNNEVFHAYTGKTVLVTNTDGDEYAQNNLTVRIDRPAVIDNKDITCSWGNGKFSDNIRLKFKVFVSDTTLNNSQHCERCEGGVEKVLRRPGIQKKEDSNLEEMIKQKVMQEYNANDVFW